MQPDDSEGSVAATAKLRKSGECDFDLSQKGAQLQPIEFNSQACTDTGKHYHGFFGEIACGRWAQAMKIGIFGGRIISYVI